jgi:hypothetical protein
MGEAYTFNRLWQAKNVALHSFDSQNLLGSDRGSGGLFNLKPSSI